MGWSKYAGGFPKKKQKLPFHTLGWWIMVWMFTKTGLEESKLAFFLATFTSSVVFGCLFFVGCGSCPYYFDIAEYQKRRVHGVPVSWCLSHPCLASVGWESKGQRSDVFLEQRFFQKHFVPGICVRGIVWWQTINMGCAWLKHFVGHRQTNIFK